MADDISRLDLGDEPVTHSDAKVSGWEYLDGSGRIQCAFSTAKTVKMGMGANSRKHDSLTYWYVEQVDDNAVEVRSINENHIPAGKVSRIPIHRLINDYRPEVSYYTEKVLPALQELENALHGNQKDGDGAASKGGPAFHLAVTLEEQNVRALFGLGLIYLARCEPEVTREMLTALAKVKLGSEEGRQHLFNELGIALRKSGQCSEAATFFRRALDFVVNDEHLYYNLARAYYELGDWSECIEALLQCHRINPALPVARKLFKLIVGLADDEMLLEQYHKPPVPYEVVDKARNILAAERARTELDAGIVLLPGEEGLAQGDKEGERGDYGTVFPEGVEDD